jgi:hypothetical protein
VVGGDGNGDGDGPPVTVTTPAVEGTGVALEVTMVSCRGAFSPYLHTHTPP